MIADLDITINESYRNRKSGYEILTYIAESIRENIIFKIANAFCFGMTLDSTSDVSGNQVLTICLRFLNEETNIIEENFMKLVELKSKTAKDIHSVILRFLRETKLHHKLIAVSTDGEATVSSLKNGVCGMLLNETPYLITCHCIVHRMSLGAKISTKNMILFRNYSKMFIIYAVF